MIFALSILKQTELPGITTLDTNTQATLTKIEYNLRHLNELPQSHKHDVYRCI